MPEDSMLARTIQILIQAQNNATQVDILGETRGAWVLGVLGAVASFAVAAAAFWSSRRANKLAENANEIADRGIEEQRRIAAEARDEAYNDRLRRHLEEALMGMRRAAAGNPLDPRLRLGGSEEITESYQKLVGTLGAFQEFGAYSSRASELDRRLRERGSNVHLAGGREELFPDFRFQEYDEHLDKLRSIADLLAELADEDRAPTAEEEWLLREEYGRVKDYWSIRWFNVPQLSERSHE